VSVYLPQSFAVRDGDAIARLVREHPFATLITTSRDEPQVTHLPLLRHAGPSPHASLIGHVARANPHWRIFGEGTSLAIFHGPHAYVSPSWYAEPAVMVPTWNYAVVHVLGRVELVTDRDQTLAILRELTERFESSRAAPWRLQLTGSKLDAMVGAIVAFRMTIERIDAKFKLSQNRSAEDQVRVIEALRAEGLSDAEATAEWMTDARGG
jgi:transcriptional regulator